MLVTFTAEEAARLTPEELEALIDKRRRECEEREQREQSSSNFIEHYDLPKADPVGEIGGVDAWSALHPDRQLTLGECEYARQFSADMERLQRIEQSR